MPDGASLMWSAGSAQAGRPPNSLSPPPCSLPTGSLPTGVPSSRLPVSGPTVTGLVPAVAGTVVLLGGAIFTFTPWHRLRR